MNEAQIAIARAHRSAGMSYRSIAKTFGVHESTVRRALKKPTKKRRVTFIIIEEDV